LFFHRIQTRLRTPIVLLLLFSMMLPVFAQDDSYTIPDPPEDIDLDLVIAEVGDTEITLGEFRQRVRLERLRTYVFLNDLISTQGDAILDLNNPQNPVGGNVQALLGFLGDDAVLGEQTYEPLVLDYIYHQEAAARGIEVTECQINQAWTNRLNLPPMGDCEVPEGFEDARTAYIDLAETYAGVSAEEMEQIVRYDAEFSAVREELVSEVELEEEPVVRTRHIRIQDEADANTAIERLADGEAFETVLADYTLDVSALGNGGDLGEFEEGMMVQPFSDAAFGAEVGELVGPVETQFGFHIIEVTDQITAEVADVRQIILGTEEEAEAAVRLLNDGRDMQELAATYSIDRVSASGDLVTVQAGQTAAGIILEEAVFSAEPGDIVGPVQTERGFYVVAVEDVYEDVIRIAARHILVETEEEAQTVLERLEAGEDFAALATELSIDPSAAGLGADTMTLATGGQAEGFYGLSELLPDFDVVFDAEVGDIVGPIDTGELGYFIFEVQEFSTRAPQNAEIQRNQVVVEWQEEQLASDSVVRTNLWLSAVPFDPMPSDVFEILAPLDEPLMAAHETYLEQREANLIPNVLRGLQLPSGDAAQPPLPPSGASDAPPGVEVNPPADSSDDFPPDADDAPPGVEDPSDEG